MLLSAGGGCLRGLVDGGVMSVALSCVYVCR